MSSINFALQQIKTDAVFETNLYHRYYDKGLAETTLQLTTEEREYIANSGTIHVGMNLARAPFSEYNEKTGEFTGINVDILNAISEKTSLKFEFVPQTNGAKVTDMMSSGDFDMICGIEKNNFNTNETLVSTDSFLESEVVPVGKSGTTLDINSDLTVAISSGYEATKAIRNMIRSDAKSVPIYDITDGFRSYR